MSVTRSEPMGDLLDEAKPPPAHSEPITEDATLLRGFAAPAAAALMAAVEAIIAAAPFRHMVTPGGHRMSVAMTNCGDQGWITDRGGYRYTAIDPMTQRCWPSLPGAFFTLAVRAAAAVGFSGFAPDACLINRYRPGARLALHQDRDERDFEAPIVSVSLGLPAVFLFGGMRRGDRPRRIRIASGDIAVWGGSARLAYHGIAPLAEGEHPLTGRYRINLTLRKAS